MPFFTCISHILRHLCFNPFLVHLRQNRKQKGDSLMLRCDIIVYPNAPSYMCTWIHRKESFTFVWTRGKNVQGNVCVAKYPYQCGQGRRRFPAPTHLTQTISLSPSSLIEIRCELAAVLTQPIIMLRFLMLYSFPMVCLSPRTRSTQRCS